MRGQEERVTPGNNMFTTGFKGARAKGCQDCGRFSAGWGVRCSAGIASPVRLERMWGGRMIAGERRRDGRKRGKDTAYDKGGVRAA